ncbi:hypothetical protein MLD38_017428 [Melastoma candidum]|uniref:Uncharacterized protein n=1 Tax=Melastoma candidum TaxID=119954 RepID=A0ACB9QRY0_9MYRT|nr:hypothetical protein MLD38_017428 [Melastoma candidum]
MNAPAFDDDRCLDLPPKVNSPGLSSPEFLTNGVLQYSLPQLEIQIILILFLTQLLHSYLKRFGVALIVSQLLVGILLSPAFLGSSEVVQSYVLPNKWKTNSIINALGVFGYTFFLFVTGVKMDMSMIWKVRKKSWAIGIATTFVPLFVGCPAVMLLADRRGLSSLDLMQLLSLAGIQSITSFPVIFCLLEDLQALNTELGRLALSSALVSNLAGISTTFLASFLDMTPLQAIQNVGLTIAFFLVISFVLRPAMQWMIAQTPEGRPVRDLYLNVVVFGVLLSSLASNQFGQSVLFGPFFFGLAVPDGPPLGSVISKKLDCFFVNLLLPIYITMTSIKVDLKELFPALRKMKPELLAINVIFLVKMSASVALPLFCKIPVNDAVVLALILCSKGVVELSYFRFMSEKHDLSKQKLDLAVTSVLLNALFVPLLVRHLMSRSKKLGGYQRRDVMSLKANAVLPILTCIYRPSDIEATINLIDSFNPRIESPVEIHVLRLIKLIGQSTPLFISHQKQRKVMGNKAYSDNVIVAFTNYMRSSSGVMQASIFTAVSPPKLMQEDVSYLALDKITSLIILPFHKKWSKVDGYVEQEDAQLRSLNCNVLERGPCSVAILIDRGRRQSRGDDATLTVGMFFLGGNDDREALALAKRMAKNPNVHLRVIHFRLRDADNKGSNISWEGILDLEALKDIKDGKTWGNVTYTLRVVEEGPETARVIRSISYKFDTVVVGRRYGVESGETKGLSAWAELPELGILGDLLASSDIDTKANILVIQQQKNPASR